MLYFEGYRKFILTIRAGKLWKGGERFEPDTRRGISITDLHCSIIYFQQNILNKKKKKV